MSSTLHCAEDADEVASSGTSGAWAPPPTPPLSSPPRFSASSFYDDAHCPVSDLLSAELQHAPRPDYLARLRDGSLDPAARRDAINWILKVQAFYRLRPMTGFLAVNYLDRFLSSQQLPKGVGWPWQLLAVACLSVAAKMEETDAPPPLDLQVLEPRFVFDPQTVGRMELLLMAALRWRMRPVTPFDFVGHFAGLLRPGGPQRQAGVFSGASELLLGTQRVLEFLAYRPSTIAAAAALYVAGDGGDDDHSSRFYDVVSKGAVDGCRRLMGQSLLDACPVSGRLKSAPAGSEPPVAPRSPAGVLDAAACDSRDTQKSAAERATKRRRLPASCTEGTGSSSVGGEEP